MYKRQVHLVQKVDCFLAVIIPVDNQVKHVAVFAFHRDELLARLAAAPDVVDQRQVAVRGQCSAVRKATEQFQQGGGFFFCKRKGEAAVSTGSFTDGQIIAADVALALREPDFIPSALRADHLNLRAIGQLGDGRVLGPSAGTDI